MSGLASSDFRNAMIWRRSTRALALCAVSAALSGCYYYVPPSTQLACVPAQGAPASGYAAPAQPPAPNGCPAGTAANYVQTPGYTVPYYGYGYGGYGYGYGYPAYGYPYGGYYGWPGYAYGPTVSVGWGWRGGWGWHGNHRWR